ncbi:type II toxin-antitoxin system RelE/ParE family toxin [Pectinatus frisingensis]|uniref:type II toxin-antitoxin system RelE/ParE family toxin n=1 Tax=Pectinatus frisingensis TaxID=865 RepID=UPI0018C80716
MNWHIEFYQKANGKIPVAEYLHSLPEKIRAKAILEIELLEKHGTVLKEPYVKYIQGKKYQGLWELRIKFSSDTARVLYFIFEGNTFVLLHGFTKKTNKTPVQELEKAIRYRKDYEGRRS